MSTSGQQRTPPTRTRLLELADDLERLALRREKVLALRDRALAERARSLADRIRRVALSVGAEASSPTWLDEWKRLASESAVLLDPEVSAARPT